MITDVAQLVRHPTVNICAVRPDVEKLFELLKRYDDTLAQVDDGLRVCDPSLHTAHLLCEWWKGMQGRVHPATNKLVAAQQ